MSIFGGLIRTRLGGGWGRRLRLGGAAVAVGLVLTACNVTIDGNTLTALDAQEESWYSDGDEPYVAVIQFRVTPGVAGSTQTRYLGNLQEIAQGIYDGESAGIPDAMAATKFPNVTMMTMENVIATGRAPEIVGAVSVAMESDASPWSAINGIMNDVRNELDRQLRLQVETLTLAQLLNPDTVSERLAEAAHRVEAASQPSFWRSVGIWFQSWGDPDDVIGFKVLLFVAAQGPLADAIDARFSSGLPPSVVGECPEARAPRRQLRGRRRHLPHPLGHHRHRVTGLRSAGLVTDSVTNPARARRSRRSRGRSLAGHVVGGRGRGWRWGWRSPRPSGCRARGRRRTGSSRRPPSGACSPAACSRSPPRGGCA